nr:4-hydroxy-tetrahydrodipicolinate synthase [Saprospiraceae bacterium]
MKETKLWTALITPLKRDGSVHYSDLEVLIKRQEEAGNGILIIGSTGEGLALSEEEKMGILNFVSELNPNVPIMVGVGGFNLQMQVDWIKGCNGLNIDAFLLVTPLYSKPGVEGQTHWFNSLLDVAEKPCMLYNVPSRSAVKMPPEVLSRVKDHPNLWAVKEASGSIADYQQFRRSAPEIPLYSGDDALTAFFAAAGCSGLVSVASNVWPKATHLYVEKCLKGETESLYPVWNDAVDALFSASNPVPAKLLLNENKVIETAVLKPPLAEMELTDLSELIRVDREIEKWYQNNKD